jgi:2-polyprenyl-3-methyl-5-hydroxy-6-metoxy-1,4-benzoquinol methylase
MLLFELYLLIPCFLFIFRYCDWIKVLSIVAAIVTIIVPFIAISNEQKICFYRKIKFVFWTVWQFQCKKIENEHFNNQQKIEKEKIYTDMNAIKEFQEHFVPYSREAELIQKHLNSSSSQFSFPAIQQTMLDIGGYDGKFTIKLLNALNLNIKNIDVVEPVDVESDYKSNLASKCPNINFQNIGLETYNSTSTFDFVLASHSLYSSIDNKKYENNSTLVSDLLSLLNDNGIMVVILGNANGRAYLLKKGLKKLILNEETEDTNSYEFEKELEKQTGILYEKLSIDSYIEVNKILKNEQTLKEWVSYFSRVPIVNDNHILEGIKDLFNIYSVQYKNLPEETKKEYRQSQKDILLLPHKTDVFLIKKT